MVIFLGAGARNIGGARAHPGPPLTTPLELCNFTVRRNLGLTGTKLGCGEGGCGACTVMVSKMRLCSEPDTGYELVHISVNACLTPVCSLHGAAVTTVEGIGSTR